MDHAVGIDDETSIHFRKLHISKGKYVCKYLKTNFRHVCKVIGALIDSHTFKEC